MRRPLHHLPPVDAVPVALPENLFLTVESDVIGIFADQQLGD
jgi:hypothetical protein